MTAAALAPPRWATSLGHLGVRAVSHDFIAQLVSYATNVAELTREHQKLKSSVHTAFCRGLAGKRVSLSRLVAQAPISTLVDTDDKPNSAVGVPSWSPRTTSRDSLTPALTSFTSNSWTARSPQADDREMGGDAQ